MNVFKDVKYCASFQSVCALSLSMTVIQMFSLLLYLCTTYLLVDSRVSASYSSVLCYVVHTILVY